MGDLSTFFCRDNQVWRANKPHGCTKEYLSPGWINMRSEHFPCRKTDLHCRLVTG